jgi:hypothetical protein
MTWRRRLVELACAGGTLAGCWQRGYQDPRPGIPCGNANPDPCICGRSPPDTPQCIAEQECEDDGGFWNIDIAETGSAVLDGECVLPGGVTTEPDAGVIDDAPVALDAEGKPDGAPAE